MTRHDTNPPAPIDTANEPCIGDVWVQINLDQIETERRKAAMRIAVWGFLMACVLVALGVAYALVIYFVLQSAAEAATLAPAMMRF